MNPEAWCVVLLLACVSGAPVGDSILPTADTNSTGFYEDSYDNITRVSEEHYVDNSTLIDSNSTRFYEVSYNNITRVSEKHVDNSTLIDSNSTRLYVDSYDDNNTKLDHNVTRSLESDRTQSRYSGRRYIYPQGCPLPTCGVHNLINNLQTGDEIAGKKTTSSFGPG